MKPPRVLVFDDESVWTKNIAHLLKPTCFVNMTTRIKRWNSFMHSSFWDAIIVDIQITGSLKNGAQLAEKAILDYGITTPVILISGNVELKSIKKKYGTIFFDYISKSDYVKKLPKTITKSRDAVTDGTHLYRMLTKLSKLHRVYEDEVISEFINKYENISFLPIREKTKIRFCCKLETYS